MLLNYIRRTTIGNVKLSLKMLLIIGSMIRISTIAMAISPLVRSFSIGSLMNKEDAAVRLNMHFAYRHQQTILQHRDQQAWPALIYILPGLLKPGSEIVELPNSIQSRLCRVDERSST